MKKLLTLVLALVLVFAIAAPALAITGETEDPEEGPELVDVAELDLAIFSKEVTYTQFTGFVLSEIAANKAYIVNEVCFYGVAVHFLEWDLPDDETEPKMDPDDFDGATLTISSDAMNLRSIPGKDIFRVNKKGKVVDYAGWKIVKDDNEVSITDFPDDWGTGATVYLFGEGVVTGKGVLKAEFALEQKLVAENTTGINIYDGRDFLYNVRWLGGDFIVVDADGIYIKFDVNADKEVDGIYVSEDGGTWLEVHYVVPVSGGGAVVGMIGSLTDDPDEDDEDFDNYLAAYEAVMKFFGFDYDAEGVLLPKHFERKFSGLNLKAEKAIQLYTAAIVVPGGVEPPKTGDAATIVGFVMIAVAMIAAGVVVSRKVRA